jgi:hypothetical protein
MDNNAARTTAQASRIRTLAVLAILLAACVLVCIYQYIPKGGAPPQSDLFIDDSTADAGELWEVSNYPWRLLIRNQSNEEREILGFTPSCTCQLSFDPESLIVPAGGEATLTVSLDLRRTGRQAKELTGEFTTTIVPHLREGQIAPERWRIRAKVRRLFEATPRVIDFGESLVRGKPFPPQSAQIRCYTLVQQMRARCEPPIADVRLTAAADNTFQLTVSPDDRQVSDNFGFSIHLAGVTQDGQSVSYTIPVMGAVLETFYCEPPAVVLGACPIGETLSRSIVIQSRDKRPYEVVGFSSRGRGDVTVEPGKPASNGCQEFRISQRVAQLAQQESTISFDIAVGDGKDICKLNVPVIYYGIPASAGNTPAPRVKKE